MRLKFFYDGSPCVWFFVEDDGIQAGALDQVGNLRLRRVIMAMDNEHVFRELDGNDGGLLGYSKVGDLILKGCDCSIQKCDCLFFSLYEPLDNFLQRCLSSIAYRCTIEASGRLVQTTFRFAAERLGQNMLDGSLQRPNPRV